MKWKLFALSVLMISLIGGCYAENVSVELIPNSVNTQVGDTFNLDLIVKNIPNDTKCAGFETTVSYDSNLLNLTDIKLSAVANNAGSKTADLSTGFISIFWSSDEPSGNITIATLSFKALNEATNPPTTISLTKTTVSDTEPKAYAITLNSSNIIITKPKADLIIDNISISNLKSYQNNIIPVEIKNIGEINTSNNFSVKLYVESQEIGEKTVNGLNVGETKTIDFAYTPLTNKNYTIVVVVDSNKEIEESNESNNQYTKTVEAIEQPIILNIIPSTNLTKTGETFTVDIKLDDIITNRPAKGIDGILTYDSKIVDCTNFTFLIDSSEGLKNISFEDGKVVFSIMDGSINTSTTIARATFKVSDVGNSEIALDGVVVSDINGYEFNNVITSPKTVKVQGPDAYIEEINVENPYYLESAKVKITVPNKGHQDLIGSFDVHLYIDSNDLGAKTIGNLTIGENKTVEFDWTPEDCKNYTIVIISDNSIDENDSNNKMVKS